MPGDLDMLGVDVIIGDHAISTPSFLHFPLLDED